MENIENSNEVEEVKEVEVVENENIDNKEEKNENNEVLDNEIIIEKEKEVIDNKVEEEKTEITETTETITPEMEKIIQERLEEKLKEYEFKIQRKEKLNKLFETSINDEEFKNRITIEDNDSDEVVKSKIDKEIEYAKKIAKLYDEKQRVKQIQNTKAPSNPNQVNQKEDFKQGLLNFFNK